MLIINSENLYVVSSTEMEKELCRMEMKYLLEDEAGTGYIFTTKDIDPSRSPYIKMKISILYKAADVNEIINKIKEDNIAYDKFKVNYLKNEVDDIPYNDRLDLVKEIGFVITGFPDIHQPAINLGIIKVDGIWIFGEIYKNNLSWQKYDKKPYSYSNALTVKVARALVNIAVGCEMNKKIVDPCCGIGTVVMEALDQGIEIKGYELSKQIASNARDNIQHFGYDRDIIKQGNMHDIKDEYDVSIVDIPYGLFSPVTKEEQQEIINTARRISRKMIIVTFEDMHKEIIKAGFKITDGCIVKKGSMNRYISICK